MNTVDGNIKETISQTISERRMKNLAEINSERNYTPLLDNNDYYFNIALYIMFMQTYLKKHLPIILENLNILKQIDENLFNQYANNINIYIPPNNIEPSASLKNILKFYSKK